MAVDAQSNVYLAGSRKSRTYNGYFAKFNSSGKHQLYKLIGDALFNTFGQALAIDDSGNIYFSGYTSSKANIASNGFQNTYGGGYSDAFLAKYDGSGNLSWATYYGGDGKDAGDALCIGPSGEIYMTRSTTSANDVDSNGHQSSLGGGDDGYLVKLNASGARQWATYYGGDKNEFPHHVGLPGMRKRMGPG